MPLLFETLKVYPINCTSWIPRHIGVHLRGWAGSPSPTTQPAHGVQKSLGRLSHWWGWQGCHMLPTGPGAHSPWIPQWRCRASSLAGGRSWAVRWGSFGPTLFRAAVALTLWGQPPSSARATPSSRVQVSWELGRRGPSDTVTLRSMGGRIVGFGVCVTLNYRAAA